MSKKVAYYRVSTKGQGKSGLGLESQRAIINHFVGQGDIIAEYTDVMSGGKNVDDRAQLKAAIKLCQSEGHTLVVAKIDRLSRVTEDALSIYSALDQRLISCDIPNLDKFTLTLFMAIADRERELIQVRTKAALAAKKARGHILGKPENFSQSGRKRGGQIRKAKAAQNKANRRATSLATALRKAGKSYRAIAAELNGNGYETATGKQFAATTVKRLIDRAAVAA